MSDTLRARWQALRRSALEHVPTGADALDDCQLAFYYGALTMFGFFDDALGLDDPRAIIARLQGLDEELGQWLADRVQRME